MRGKPSLVYIRFKNNDSNVDYLDSRNGGTIEWYEETVPMADRIEEPRQMTKFTSPLD